MTNRERRLEGAGDSSEQGRFPALQGEPTSLPLEGFELLEIWLSGQVFLIAYGDSPAGTRASGLPLPPRTQIALGGAFEYRSSKGETHLLSGDERWVRLAPLLELQHARFTAARVGALGYLTLTFDNGSEIRAGPELDFESWTVSGPGNLDLFCLPGGPVAR